MLDDRDDIESPCIKICKMSTEHLCIGCARTIEEIACWTSLDKPARLKVLQDVAERRAGKREPLGGTLGK
jgi:predicted Fe-S protein YdhL (DUF1289 family)